jgi:hypothetical protein
VPSAVYLPSLQHLDISGVIPQGESTKQEFELSNEMFSHGHFSNLKSLAFGHFHFNEQITRDVFIGLTNLTSIAFYDSEMILENGVFNELYNLREVSLAESDKVQFCISIFNGSTYQLQKLNLSGVSVSHNCKCDFDYTALEHVKNLDLSKMKYASASNTLRPFNILDCLNFTKIPELEVIDLSGNEVSSWEESVFGENNNLTKLTMIHEDQNIILTDAMIEDFNRTVLLDLSRNIFGCNEQKIVKFYQLAKHKTVIGWKNGSGYRCINDKGEYKTFLEIVQSGEEMPDGCCPIPEDNPVENTLLTVIISSVGAAISVVIFGALVSYYTYSNMWNIKFWLAKRKIKQDQNFDSENAAFLYDAFVSYSSEDQKWVDEELSPLLEEKTGLKLCLHERDFSAGLPIIDNIVQSLEQSRACLVILSEGYAKSEWCNFELNCAYQIFSEQNRSIVVIVLDEPSPENLKKTMKYILKTRTYLEWKNEKSMDHVNSIFWQRVLQTINNTTTNNNIYTCKT